MKKSAWLEQDDDREVLMTFLPSGWQAKAKELGALLRCRVFDSAENLLRTLLIHLADGCSSQARGYCFGIGCSVAKTTKGLRGMVSMDGCRGHAAMDRKAARSHFGTIHMDSTH
jgi:hypothetical protein